MRPVVGGTAVETGSEFFRGLARNLAQALSVQGASVTEYLVHETHSARTAHQVARSWVLLASCEE